MNYFVPYAIYLVLLFVGIFIFSQREKNIRKQKYMFVYYGVAFIPVATTFFVAFLPTLPNMTGKLFLITAVYALINGTLEEPDLGALNFRKECIIQTEYTVRHGRFME